MKRESSRRWRRLLDHRSHEIRDLTQEGFGTRIGRIIEHPVRVPCHQVGQHTRRLRTAQQLIAFARPHANGDVMLTFVDHPALAAALTTLTDAQALTAEQLQTALSQVDLNALSQHEPDQINYWKPTTVGELLFNFWD